MVHAHLEPRPIVTVVDPVIFDIVNSDTVIQRLAGIQIASIDSKNTWC